MLTPGFLFPFTIYNNSFYFNCFNMQLMERKREREDREGERETQIEIREDL
jgi:hypothetical protein